MRQGFALSAALHRLRRDEGGSIWLQAVFVLLATFAFAGLAIDGARYYMLHSDLQDMADAAALAGAKELDGQAGAIARATDAAQNYFNSHACPYSAGSPATGNCARWWDTAGAAYASVGVYEKLSDIPATPIDPTNDAGASFIKVTTGSWSVVPTILAAIGVTASQPTGATATAGSTFVACNVQPLMLCNPNEPNEFNPTAGTLFGFTQQGGGAGLSPGDFSLLDPAGQTNSSATQIRNLLSQASPNFCYVNNVSPRPGQAASAVADGTNVRFDMQPQGNNQLAGLDQTPAPNVIKGSGPNSNGNGGGNSNNCNTNNYTGDYTTSAYPFKTDARGIPTGGSVPNPLEPPQTGQLPGALDSTQSGHLITGTQMDMTAANTYWNYHYGSNWPTSGGVPLTRSQAYCTELGLPATCFTSPADPLPTGTPSTVLNGTENPAPRCSTASTGDISRRILNVAIVNCAGPPQVQGNVNLNVRPNSYAEFFLVQQVDSTGPNGGIIWAEFVRTVTPSSEGSKLHQVIRLYNK